MNSIGKNNIGAEVLRQALKYSTQFIGKIFYVMVDAEPFGNYNYDQLVQDLLLVVRSCQAKIVVIVGCFPSDRRTRGRGKKEKADFDMAISATQTLQRQFGQFAETIKIPRGGWNLLPSQISSTLESGSVAIVPTVEFQELKPVIYCEVQKVLSSLGGVVEHRKVDKILIVSDHDGVFDEARQFLPQLDSAQMQRFINEEIVGGELAVICKTALHAINNLGIKRVHIVNGTKPDEFVLELFTAEGSGTMIYSGEYVEIRRGSPDDLDGMHNLQRRRKIASSEIKGNLDQFLVAAIDDQIIAFARVQPFNADRKVVVSSLVVSSNHAEMGLKLLYEATKIAADCKASALFLTISENILWWLPSDFEKSSFSELPQAAQEGFGEGLKPKIILVKSIS